MSKVGKYNLTCPCCKKEFMGVLYETLNVTLDPISYKMVKSGEALSVKCPNCNNVINVNHPLLYNDMDNKFLVSSNISICLGINSLLESIYFNISLSTT